MIIITNITTNNSIGSNTKLKKKWDNCVVFNFQKCHNYYAIFQLVNKTLYMKVSRVEFKHRKFEETLIKVENFHLNL